MMIDEPTVSYVTARNCIMDHCKTNEKADARWRSFVKRFGERKEYSVRKITSWLGYRM